VPVPAAFDQFFWADRLARSGAGTKPVSVRRLSAARLAAAIGQAVADPRITRRAGEIAGSIRCEDGVAEAARLIDLHLCADTAPAA
jgi:UDP:flavonoid glycosyltransferase YjiC (YdhE family)